MEMLSYIAYGVVCVVGGALVTGLVSGITRQKQINYAYMEGFVDGEASVSAASTGVESEEGHNG